jgi:phage gpG-like protein
MTQTFSLLGFVRHLAVLEADMHAAEHAIIMKACIMIANAAKEALGTYEFGWVSLKPETIARKMRGDSPLLETAELKNSIQWNASGNTGAVGTDLDRGMWMEFGTSKIPPRSFLAAAAQQQEHLIHEMAIKAVRSVMRGEHGSNELRELLHVLHLVKHAAEKLNEMIPEADER